MPELPELQAHAERLDSSFASITLGRFTPLAFHALKTVAPPATDALGQALVFVGRRGKYLLADFGSLTFVVHLMQGGRLRVDEKQAPRPRHGLARWVFADDRAWLLTEMGTERRAGVWAVGGDPETQAPILGLGPDADTVGPAQLLDLLRAHPMRLHGLLRDQRVIAGLGRRLANEVCHRARLSPFAPTARLTPDDAARIVEAIGVCVNESLAFERGRDDMSSAAERPGNVHHRGGQACSVCGDIVRAVEYRAYTVDYCSTCQTGGKVLADNTTSRFLK